jgi:hypothetical protein
LLDELFIRVIYFDQLPLVISQEFGHLNLSVGDLFLKKSIVLIPSDSRILNLSLLLFEGDCFLLRRFRLDLNEIASWGTIVGRKVVFAKAC